MAAQPISFLEGLRFYARTNHNARLFFRSGLRATYFLHTKKVGKDVPRGVSLEPRMVLIFRAIVGTPQWRVTGPNARRFRVSFRGRPGVLSMKIDSDADT